MKYLFLLANLTIALWVFYDSQKYGYSVLKGILWAIGVFFLLFVFLPIYLIVRNKRKKLAAQARRAAAYASLTPCLYCGQGYPGDPEICPNCGQILKR